MRLWRKQNREHINITRKKYRERKRKEALARGETWREEPKEKIDKRRERWRLARAEHVKNYARDYQRKRRRECIQARLRGSLRSRIRAVIKKGYYSASTTELLGCNMDTFKKHLEKQFVGRMTWDTYGVRGWHIDHIIPCDHFDLSCPQQAKECFNYKNLQPLWAKDNIIKSNKMI